ncbi:hypothetical protein [Burkholderia gladioli]|uniref:hypothetical protein n=1 Tax=Burkholderia gladioli TaxID=28095 RepID=UPI00163EC430|nr:hypothetical protein [Burkholderia gladioli]
MDLDKDLNSAAVFSEKFAPYEIAAASTPPPEVILTKLGFKIPAHINLDNP